MMKMEVIYHSKSGNTKRMAEEIVRGMQRVADVEARAFSIDAVDWAFAGESRAIVLGTPVYAAGMSAEMKVFLDKESGKLGAAGKLAGAFATANFVHGGGETSIQALLTHLMVHGALVYSGGGALGQPVIHLGPVAIAPKLDDYAETFQIYGERMAKKAIELF